MEEMRVGKKKRNEVWLYPLGSGVGVRKKGRRMGETGRPHQKREEKKTKKRKRKRKREMQRERRGKR